MENKVFTIDMRSDSEEKKSIIEGNRKKMEEEGYVHTKLEEGSGEHKEFRITLVDVPDGLRFKYKLKQKVDESGNFVPNMFEKSEEMEETIDCDLDFKDSLAISIILNNLNRELWEYCKVKNEQNIDLTYGQILQENITLIMEKLTEYDYLPTKVMEVEEGVILDFYVKKVPHDKVKDFMKK